MPTIPVAIAGRPYEVRVGHGLIADLARKRERDCASPWCR
jgi:hypothetical protein